jgi:hypothetical protein
MERKIRIAHGFFMISFCAWILVLAVTPVGGWHENNTWREYYMTAFCITGIMSLVSLLICFKIEK